MEHFKEIRERIIDLYDQLRHKGQVTPMMANKDTTEMCLAINGICFGETEVSTIGKLTFTTTNDKTYMVMHVGLEHVPTLTTDRIQAMLEYVRDGLTEELKSDTPIIGVTDELPKAALH